MNKIKTALISVSNKKNIKLILDILKKNKIKIISSGGTYKEIKKLKFKCIEVSEFTNSPEILDGRVKTLHPKIILFHFFFMRLANSFVQDSRMYFWVKCFYSSL